MGIVIGVIASIIAAIAIAIAFIYEHKWAKEGGRKMFHDKFGNWHK